jgi:uncharacterized protein (TIGR03000 family)
LVLVAPGQCFAQLVVQFPGDYPNPARGVGYQNGGFVPIRTDGLPFPYDGVRGDYAAPMITVSAPVAVAPVYRSAYPQVVAVVPARIHVHVPANAKVLIDSNPTAQTGTDRVFRTPALADDHPYSYEISARWTQDGTERRETRVVRFLPGQTVEVDFTR